MNRTERKWVTTLRDRLTFLEAKVADPDSPAAHRTAAEIAALQFALNVIEEVDGMSDEFGRPLLTVIDTRSKRLGH